MRRVPLITALLALLTLVPAITSGQTLLLLGDSLSAGYGLSQSPGWPELLRPRLEARGWQLVNASISGETSAGGLSRLPALLERHRPDLVLIELGANDGLRGLPPQLLRQNLTGMIEQVQNASGEVILAQMQLPPNYGQSYTRLFADTFIETGLQHGIPLLPFLLEGVAGRSELIQADGLHPNDAAQPLIAENVWLFLESEGLPESIIDPDHKVKR